MVLGTRQERLVPEFCFSLEEESYNKNRVICSGFTLPVTCVVVYGRLFFLRDLSEARGGLEQVRGDGGHVGFRRLTGALPKGLARGIEKPRTLLGLYGNPWKEQDFAQMRASLQVSKKCERE